MRVAAAPDRRGRNGHGLRRVGGRNGHCANQELGTTADLRELEAPAVAIEVPVS
jgi:hypothetical protein